MNKKNNKKNALILVIILLLMGGFVWFIYQDLFDNQEDQVSEANNATTTSSLRDDISVDVESDGEVQVETIEVDKPQTPVNDSQTSQEKQQKPAIIRPIPDLDRKIVFTGDYPEDARQMVIDKMEEMIEELKNDPTFFSNWLYLGLSRKGIGDYEGARQAWEYAKLLDTNNFVVRGNLGDLYAYYLKDNENAEKNYLEALQLGPSQIYLYFKVSDFYKDVLKNSQKAKEIVQTGLQNNPNNPELQSLLQSF